MPQNSLKKKKADCENGGKNCNSEECDFKKNYAIQKIRYDSLALIYALGISFEEFRVAYKKVFAELEPRSIWEECFLLFRLLDINEDTFKNLKIKLNESAHKLFTIIQELYHQEQAERAEQEKKDKFGLVN